ncbi:hypothetical protein BG015_000456, partial [Linnemannia schmuckeri]
MCIDDMEAMAWACTNLKALHICIEELDTKPKFRKRLSCYVPTTTALNCMLVFKAWADDFRPAIWRTVDLQKHALFESLDQRNLSQYGALIRQIIHSTTYQTYLSDLVRRNNATLASLNLYHLSQETANNYSGAAWMP